MTLVSKKKIDLTYQRFDDSNNNMVSKNKINFFLLRWKIDLLLLTRKNI